MAVLATSEFKDELGDLGETRKAVESAENRARIDQRKTNCKVSRTSDREFAEALHREADLIYRSGDYETALVLYHRAAKLFPKDTSHSVAARRTAATISSWNNPPKAVRKLSPSARTEARLTVALCPESAAAKANDILKKKPDPDSVSEVLSYFDNHKPLWTTLPSSVPSITRVARSKVMLRQLGNLASMSLKNLTATFDSGKMTAALKSAQELLALSSGLPDPSHYQIAAYHYLSLIHVSLGRHDRAVSNVSRMVRVSQSTGDVVQTCRSLVTLGKVHLSFGHLEAAARAWENLSTDIKEPIPRAWIRHEIGRCYLETGKYRQAYEMASRCEEAASEGDSKKWMLHAKLLQGQSLAKLGRFAEALEELKISASITEEEGDTQMLSYTRDLIERVTRALRRIAFEDDARREEETSKLAPSPERGEEGENLASASPVFTSGEDALITTVFSRTKTENDNETHSSGGTSDGDEEITACSEGKRSLMQSYREGEVRSDAEEEQDEKEVLPGSSTFRVRSPARSPSSSASSSRVPSFASASSSSSSNSDDDEDTGKTKVAREEFTDCSNKAENDSKRTFEVEAKEDTMDFVKGSARSFKSCDTSLTYVIEGQGEPSAPTETKRDSIEKNEDKVTASMKEESIERLNKSDGKNLFTEVVTGWNDETMKDKEDLLNTLRVIEELDKKDEGQLLELLRDMLMTPDNEERSDRVLNAEQSFSKISSRPDSGRKLKIPQFCEESREKMKNHSLYRHSLPSSPRTNEPDMISHTCEGRPESLESN